MGPFQRGPILFRFCGGVSCHDASLLSGQTGCVRGSREVPKYESLSCLLTLKDSEVRLLCRLSCVASWSPSDSNQQQVTSLSFYVLALKIN